MSNLGPAFLLYPSDFLDGIRDLNEAQTNFYVRLVFRMYDIADSIRLDDRLIGKMCNSNAQKWKRIRSELVSLGKLHILSDGSIMNRRAARQMLQICIDRHGRHNQPDEDVIERLAKVSHMFGRSLGKVSHKFRETYSITIPKNPNENNDSKKHPSPSPSPLPLPEEDKSSSSRPDEEDLLFQQFWDGYPRTQGQNRKAVYVHWDKLTPDEQNQAVASLPAYRSCVNGEGWLPLVFIRDRIFNTIEADSSLGLEDRIAAFLDAQEQEDAA